MKAKLTVYLSAIQNNYRILCDKTQSSICAVVVKANAYGLGLQAVTTSLYESGARHFFVAQLNEAITLRAIATNAKIYVLNGLFEGEEEEFSSYDLIPCLNHVVQVELWAKHAQYLDQKLPSVIHIDTGLNRLGFNVDDFKLLDIPVGIDLQLLMSHLACADEPLHPMNKTQLDVFLDATKSYPHIKKSLSASDGIFCGTRFHFDMVRPGAALYGLNSRPGMDNPMSQVVRLQVPIIQVREVTNDGTVGYGATKSVNKNQRLATVALGYADGLLRSLSNQGNLYFGDHALPILGRVSMDLITVDISDLPEAVLQTGMYLDVYSPYQTPEQLAKMAGTIDYELFTALGQRFERHYQS